MNRRTAFCALSLVALLLALATPQASAVPDQDYSYARIVRLSYVEGDIQVQRPEEAGWEDALLNLPIRQGYQISTRHGRGEVEFESGAVARLADDTQLQFTELALSNGGRLTQLTMLSGTATFYVNLSKEDRFTVTTPNFTVNVPRNARFRIDSGPDGATVTVQKGDVDVDAMGMPYHVTKNRAFLFRVEGEQITLARAPDTDSWDRWVEERENIISESRNAASSRYLTRTGFSYGMYDLDYYGGWYNVSGYGRCWQPYSIPIGWSPYGFGRFVYVNGFGFTWVSFEPWGWLPYHYGHWVHTLHGWYWVPGGFGYWRPALVYWVNLGNNHWGWGPLHPHDRPGQPPTNLPNGTVTNNTPTPTGYGSVDRRNVPVTSADIGRAKLGDEPPETFLSTRFRGRRLPDGDNVTPVAAPTGTTGTPAAGYSGTVKGTRPGDVARDDEVNPRPRAGEVPTGDAGKPAAPAAGYSGTTKGTRPGDVARDDEGNPRGRTGGIVYDPKTGRYINGDVPGRKGDAARGDAPATPAAPAASGYSGTTTTPAATPTTPKDIRGVDRDTAPRDENRLPGRRDIPESTVRPTPQPRYEAQPRMPASTPSQTQTQPRVDTPHSTPPPQPRYESQPRPASPPPSQPPPRMESPRPASPPPAPPPAPRPDSGGQQHRKPPQ